MAYARFRPKAFLELDLGDVEQELSPFFILDQHLKMGLVVRCLRRQREPRLLHSVGDRRAGGGMYEQWWSGV